MAHKTFQRFFVLLLLAASSNAAGLAALADVGTGLRKETVRDSENSAVSPVAAPVDGNWIKLPQQTLPRSTDCGVFTLPAGKDDDRVSKVKPDNSSATTNFGDPFGKYAPVSFHPFSRSREEDHYAGNLCQYVCEPLRAAVHEFDIGEYSKALAMVTSLTLDHRRYSMYEPHYVRALCLQKLGRFSESSIEYKVVIDNSQNKLLTTRAAMGLEYCNKHELELPQFLLRFPSDSTPLLPGDFDTNI